MKWLPPPSISEISASFHRGDEALRPLPKAAAQVKIVASNSIDDYPCFRTKSQLEVDDSLAHSADRLTGQAVRVSKIIDLSTYNHRGWVAPYQKMTTMGKIRCIRAALE